MLIVQEDVLAAVRVLRAESRDREVHHHCEMVLPTRAPGAPSPTTTSCSIHSPRGAGKLYKALLAAQRPRKYYDNASISSDG